MNSPAEQRLEIDLPAGFAGIPIDGSAQDITERIREVSTRASEQVQEDAGTLAGYLGEMVKHLAPKDIRLVGKFAVGAETLTEPALATLALAMPELDFTDSEQITTAAQNRNVVAAQLVKQYKARHPDADARVVELSIGPAMVAQRAGAYHIPPEVTGTSTTEIRPEFKAEFQIPTPDGTRLVMLTVTTGSEAGWPTVAATASRIANSIRFEEAPEDRAGENGEQRP